MSFLSCRITKHCWALFLVNLIVMLNSFLHIFLSWHGQIHERRVCWCERVLSLMIMTSLINPTPTGGPTLCPSPHLPQVHFLKYLKNALSYGLETFWQFHWTIFQHKKFIFLPPLLTLGYHSNIQSWRMFLKMHFGSFHAQDYQNSNCFSYFH